VRFISPAKSSGVAKLEKSLEKQENQNVIKSVSSEKLNRLDLIQKMKQIGENSD
jgi:hypothetical protein